MRDNVFCEYDKAGWVSKLLGVKGLDSIRLRNCPILLRTEELFLMNFNYHFKIQCYVLFKFTVTIKKITF